MFRNQYDNDTTVWSPQGRLFQVEYAMEAVQLGTATVGLKSRDYALLVALCRTVEEGNSVQQKIMPVDVHVGMSIAGLTADGRTVCQHLRTECRTYRHSYDENYPVKRLLDALGNKMQSHTQRYSRRPYGVGMLFAGYDEGGTYIYQVMPSATVLSCKAMAIGCRSQSARSYLERYVDEFLGSSKTDLIDHGIKAIYGALGNRDSKDLIINMAMVGKDMPFTIFSQEEIAPYLEKAKIAI
ncbi:hypothetical protein KR018_009188, partial [Drosophila ironensis]